MPTDIADGDVWVRGSSKYDLRMYGTLANGEKAVVHLTDVPVYFDYDVSVHNTDWRLSRKQISQMDAGALASIERDGLAQMRAILTEMSIAGGVSDLRATWQYPMHGFTLSEHLYVRVIFTSMRARGDCIKKLRDGSALLVVRNPSLIAHDDSGFNTPSYFNAVARDYHFMTAGWNMMRNYEYHPISPCDAGGAVLHSFNVSLARGDFTTAPTPKDDAEIAARMHDPSLIESWDIETENEIENGDIPDVGNAYTITTISLVYSYSWTEVPLACFVLSIYESAQPRASDMIGDTPMTFITCANEREMLFVRAQIAARMLPDMRVAFNGSNFDWKLYNDKVMRYGLCADIMSRMDLAYAPSQRDQDDTSGARARDAYKWRFAPVKVKVGAENTHECAVVSLMAGTLDIDIMPAMRRIYKNEEVRFGESLNRYLEKAKLPPKNDIYHKVMRRMLQRARVLADPQIPRTCHCSALSDARVCAFCAAFTSGKARVREIDFAPVDTSAPMHTWTYHDGHDGTEPRMRDEKLAHMCCACAARPINEEDVARISAYCGIDSVRPLQLMRKLGVGTDNRELSNATYTSLFDSYYRADGMRVVNFIGSLARDFNLAIPTKSPSRPKVRYPGAYVFEPILGIHDRPVTALDFSSLYPSLILAYNISPDMIITSQAAADELTALGYDLHRIEPFEYEEFASGAPPRDFDDDRKRASEPGTTRRQAHGWSVRHNGVLASPSEILTSGPRETVRYDADDREIKGRLALEREHISLFGAAVRFLLDSRKTVRAEMARIENQIKAIFALALKGCADAKSIEIDMLGFEAQSRAIFAKASGAAGAKQEDIARWRKDAADLELRWKCLNSKQLALKILSNTFYGQMGSSISVCYTLIGAAGVPAAGRYNIQRVAALLRGLGYTIVYGDTDSVYTRAPEALYAAIDAEWRARGPVERGGDGTMTLKDYWSAQIIAARADMDVLRLRVSAFLRGDNGTRFLNMAYEEVGMPSAFFGKKKYILRPHVKGVTFEARSMIRGIKVVQQGCAPVTKAMGNAIIEDILAVRENKDIIEIVRKRIEEYYTTPDRDLSQFIQFKTYKPSKKNAAVLRFVERMRERHARLLRDAGPVAAAAATPPEAGDKFPYVVVERDTTVSLSGHCVSYAVGDRMEYPSMVASGKMQIDRRHYMNGSLMSLFARFVSSDAQFAPENDPDPSIRAKFHPEEEYKPYDEYRQSRATQFLYEICAQYNSEDTSRIHAIASKQRSTVGAFVNVVQEAARDASIFIDTRVVRLLVNDRMREICAGNIGDRVSDEAIDALVALITEMSAERSSDSIIMEGEMCEAYSRDLAHVHAPRELAERYSRETFEKFILAPLIATRDRIRNELRMDFAARIIATYRRKRIDEVLSGIAMNAVETGMKGKVRLMPEIGRAIAFDKGTLTLLHDLGKQMADFSVVSRDLRREAEMRKRFAADKIATGK